MKLYRLTNDPKHITWAVWRSAPCNPATSRARGLARRPLVCDPRPECRARPRDADACAPRPPREAEGRPDASSPRRGPSATRASPHARRTRVGLRATAVATAGQAPYRRATGARSAGAPDDDWEAMRAARTTPSPGRARTNGGTAPRVPPPAAEGVGRRDASPARGEPGGRPASEDGARRRRAASPVLASLARVLPSRRLGRSRAVPREHRRGGGRGGRRARRRSWTRTCSAVELAGEFAAKGRRRRPRGSRGEAAASRAREPVGGSAGGPRARPTAPRRTGELESNASLAGVFARAPNARAPAELACRACVRSPAAGGGHRVAKVRRRDGGARDSPRAAARRGRSWDDEQNGVG